ncbi:transposase, Mutator family protein, partial [Mycobacterium ulcerans str. Harvey]
MFIDALHVKIRDGQVGPGRSTPRSGSIWPDTVTCWHVGGEGDGESAKYWLAVLTELKNRGVADIFFWSVTA